MKKLLAMLLAAAMVLSLFAACSKTPDPTDPKPTDAKPTDAASTEAAPTQEEPKEITGEVNIYMASSEDCAIAWKKGFEAAYPGVTLNYVMLGGGEILTRLRAEKDNPQADAIVGGAVDIYMNASKEGLLAPYEGDVVLKDGAIAEDKTYIVDRECILGICYDKDWYDANGVAYPTTWDDLLIPELEGQVIITNPGTSTTGYMMMSSLIALRGEEAGMQYMVDLDKNIKSYAKGGTGPVNSVSLGEAAAGMCYIHFAIQLQEQGYTNVGVCIPTEGTGVEQGSSALVANSKNPEAAQAFMDWYLTEGLKVYEEVGQYLYPANPDVHVNEVAAEYAKQLKNANVDYAWAAENYDRLVEIWDASIAAK